MNIEPQEKVSRTKCILAMDEMNKHAEAIVKRIDGFKEEMMYPNAYHIDQDFEDLFFDLNQSISELVKYYEVDIYY